MMSDLLFANMHYTNCYASGTENLEQNLIKKRKYYEYKSGKNKDSKRYYKSNCLEWTKLFSKQERQ